MNPASNPYAVTGFLTTGIILAIGLYVYLKQRKSPIHWAFLLFTLSVSEWSFFSALHTMTENSATSLLFSKICHAGALLTPVFFYYFTQKIIGRNFKTSLRIGFLISCLLILVNFTSPLFLSGTRTDVGVPNFAKASPFYWIIILFFSIYVSLSFFRLVKEIRISQGTRKKHIACFFYASLAGFLIGFFNFFPLYGWTIPPYPYSPICGAVYSGIVAYAILMHKLFDIELIIKRGLVFGALFGAVYAAVSALIFLAGYFSTPSLSPLLFGLSIALAMAVYEPLRKLLTGLTHRFLFQKKTAYVRLIRDLTDRLSEIRDSRIISSEITGFLSKQMSLDWVALYLKDDDERFKLCSWAGNESYASRIELNAIVPLAQIRPSPLILSPFDIEEDIESGLKAKLRAQKIEAVVPIFVEESLNGILLLGKKKSDDALSRQDEALLKTLAEESSMLFISIKLLKDLNRANLELGQRKKMSSLTQLSRGVHHEVRNPLHTVSLTASTILENIRLGKYRMLERKELALKINTRIESMLEEINRIKDSLSRFAEFARPDKEPEFIPLSLKNELEEFFHLMREGQKLDSIEVHNSVPENLSVLATKAGLQEIFFNLFNNAYEAMEGRGELFLEANEHEGFTELTFKDSGPGIPEEILPGIFEEYFTTKTNSESTGIGLSIVKHRAELFGGSVTASSPPGSGALFHIKLKIAEGVKTQA
ncbi:MAG: hypothetical protein HZA14_11950 [Nitrospirae bacterium]|nr:hypothetical protein [Nitrospirota bacterium]